MSYTDEQLLRRALKNPRPKYRSMPCERWLAVMDVFALGSTEAVKLCRRFDFDPFEVLK